MAHIGVLKVLEDLKIPIDCIAGTSMGAIVGGLYASGMTAKQIDATMRSLDWQEAFRDAPPRRDLAFRRKQDDRNFLVRLPLGLKHGKMLLPKGFIQGQKLQETLRQLTLPFSNSTDFDLLPTPFRAVATDLETGKAVLMDKGDLAIAMRASMSAPGVFAPVELNGRLLVDGGLAENLPINVARAMHADVLIVSDVSFPLQPRAALDSALSISNQMLAILVRKDSDRQRASLESAGHFDRAQSRLGDRDGFHRPRQRHRRRRGCGARRRGQAVGLQRRRFRLSRVLGAPRGARARPAGHPVRAGRRAIQALREDHHGGDAAAGGKAAGPQGSGQAHHGVVRAWGISRPSTTPWSSNPRARPAARTRPPPPARLPPPGTSGRREHGRQRPAPGAAPAQVLPPRAARAPTRKAVSECGRGANPGVPITCASV